MARAPLRLIAPYYAISAAFGLFIAWVAYRAFTYGFEENALLVVVGGIALGGVILPMFYAGMEFQDDRATGFAIAVMSLVFLAAGAFSLWDQVRWARRSQPGMAEVVDVEARRETDQDGKVKNLHFPVLEYRTPDGGVHRFTGSTSRTFGTQSGWDRGERVAIRYDPAKPGEARQANSLGWVMAFGFLGLGVIALAMAVHSIATAGDESG
jgi:hypothetical protein